MEPKAKRTAENSKSKARNAQPAEALQVYWVAYNVALETDVVEMIEQLEIKNYTRWDDIKGSGNSGPHLNDEVWPAVNALYMFAAPESLEPALAECVGKIRAQFPGEGIKLIVQPCSGIY